MDNEVNTKEAARGNNHGKEKITVVGLFRNADPVEDVVQEIEARGLPRNEVRTLEEPESFEVSGVMSFPRLDFEVGLTRALRIIGATQAEAETYVRVLRRGGALVFATSSSDEEVAAAAEIMDQHGAAGIEAGQGGEPNLPYATRGVKTTSSHPSPGSGGQVGRIRPGGSAYFVW